MSNLEVIIFVNIYGSFGLSLVYLYLYKEYKEKYMGIWAVSWLLFAFRIGLDLARLKGITNLGLLALNQIASVSSVLFLLWGMYIFRQKVFPKQWLYSALIVTILSDTAMLLNYHLTIVALPTSTFFGVSQIWVGVMFFQSRDLKGWGKIITGFALISIGTLNLCYPLNEYGVVGLSYIQFFSIAMLLWTVILIGVLLVYFEKVRREITSSEERFRLLAENAKDVVYRYCLYPKPHLEYVSPAIMNLAGYTPEELCSSPELVRSLIHPRHHLYLEDFTKLKEIIDKPFVQLLVHKDGHNLWTEQHIVPISDQWGNLIALEGIIRDVTERKVFEQEVIKLDRLHVLGQTAATIAHEIRNPMTSVHGFLQLLQKKENLAEYQEWFKLMIDELERANIIISDYLSLSRDVSVVKQRININQVVKSLLPLIESTAVKESKQLRVELKNAVELELNEREVRQMILNLSQNGFEAMNKGGVLTISTFEKDNEVNLVVEDQGPGIREDILKKLGTPFLTTKEKGTGLGLSVCYQVAAKHKAQIDVQTNSSGTKFTVKFEV